VGQAWGRDAVPDHSSDAVGSGRPRPQGPTTEPDEQITHVTWRALGTGIRLVVLDGDLEAGRLAVTSVLDDVDLAYSRFRPDSELMAVNRAAGRAVRVGPLLERALEGALEAAHDSGGAVDLTVGRAMRLIGYDADFDLIAAAGRTIELRAVPVPGWESVRLDRVAHTVRIPAGVELDLGSTGKGLAADLAASAAHGAAGADAGVLVSLGGDLATAGRAPRGGWRILATDDSETPVDGDGEVIAFDRGAVATSSTTVRRWTVKAGVTAHHIVDPRTGLPAATPWRTVTVVATTCERANAASTAAIVMGDAAPDWLRATGLPARLVATDGSVVRVAGWPEPTTSGRQPARRPGP
jgi:thiamine biosynthesis lipoprotein ApbE